MDLPEKVVKEKNIMNIWICLSERELSTIWNIGSFEFLNEKRKYRNKLKDVHAHCNINKKQEEGSVFRLGFGLLDSIQDKKNGIYYTMEINENIENKHVHGTIKYIIQTVEIDGKHYSIKNGYKTAAGKEIISTIVEDYKGKKQKDSTLFRFLRKIITHGLFQFGKVGEHLELVTDTKRNSNKPSDFNVKSSEWSIFDKKSLVKYRPEQGELRDRLLHQREVALCQMCGHEFPESMLWAAHIKKRCECDDTEMKDLDNIALLMCKFGCDDLFEKGYIAVNKKGIIEVTQMYDFPVFRERLNLLKGQHCPGYTEKNKEYFEWHYENIFIK
ncbi:hypothetical protein [Chengkuizengella axinellae]|uniref:HNH endonuclease n=1 Tax=Chengkuizengella axinellae TaxID=3064388 RepID=A0ABT9J3J4_9BACL|nr:hypothetical protein [Chengkuizengella sp. 2205SS18-9]MDP5276170.1 hypothetical protein [Chengkuizengella sp. 2205SS18-9]